MTVAARRVRPRMTEAGAVGRALATRALLVRPPEPQRIVYNSFNGRFSDNPRAIYEEITRRTAECTHVWTAREPAGGAFPAATRTVVPGTARHVVDVHRAKYIVANVEMREQLRKRPGVVFLQTWHGTALKRIGYDN